MKRIAPAAERNTTYIVEVLRGFVPEEGTLLEVASGTGQHATAFAEAFSGLEIQPSDPDPQARESIAAYVADQTQANLRPPVEIDARTPDWPVTSADVLVAINMVHISPWTATLGLLDGAARVLPEGGVLYLYGPYLIDGAPTTESNAAFDASLRRRNPEWGIRDLAAVTEAAAERGLERVHVRDMPANNFSVVFRRRGGSADR